MIAAHSPFGCQLHGGWRAIRAHDKEPKTFERQAVATIAGARIKYADDICIPNPRDHLRIFEIWNRRFLPKKLGGRLSTGSDLFSVCGLPPAAVSTEVRIDVVDHCFLPFCYGCIDIPWLASHSGLKIVSL